MARSKRRSYFSASKYTNYNNLFQKREILSRSALEPPAGELILTPENGCSAGESKAFRPCRRIYGF
ncbi:hypothetical protein G9409_00180 [Chlorobium sp. BLA1]|uniref:hypothetical protein n=1 Tax=Candidatus Chlorobium masyuteum TaxID=2716876 RepID=UPI001423EE4F|nr:hypothetical protein [Candidatus Chlorobium masyuteum]NHQ59017.1 hypothetical protein [Candidatus Chlorobium masyuteum]